MALLKNLQVCFDMDKKQTLVINDLKKTNTVKDLKQIIVDRELGSNKTIENVKLIFGGKVLSDNNKKLGSCRIQSNRQIVCIIRLRGGSQGEGSITIDEEALKKLNVRITEKTCGVGTKASCTSDGTKRIQLPECNYKCTYCIPCLEDQYKKCIYTACSLDVICGFGNSTDPDNLDTCKGSTLDLDIVFKAISASEDEEKACFEQLNKNGMKNDTSIKSCPGCQCYVFKQGIDHNRVRCNKKNCPLKEDWCWSCQGTWKGQTSNNKICGNDQCGDSDLALKTALLLNCDRVYIEYNKIGNVPSRRLCPFCDRVVEWMSNCKHLTCPNKECNHEFCCVCVEDWAACKCKECKGNNGNNEGCSNGKTCSVVEPSELL